MQFLTVHHSLNQIYNVEKTVIEQAVKKAVNEVKKIKVKKTDITLISISSSVEVKITVAIEKGAAYNEVIPKLYAKIEQYIENLVGSKAKNIRIAVSETY